MTPFTQKQLEVIRYNNNYAPLITILEGAIRSAKTYCLFILFAMHVYSFKGRKLKFVMMGNTISSLKRNVLDEMGTYFGIDIILNSRNEFKMFGNTVCCFGSDSVDSYKAMKGFTAFGGLANEITDSHVNSVDQFFKRCSGEGARMFIDTNPSHPQHPIKTDYIDHSGESLTNGKEYIKSWHFVLDDNTFLTEEYKESVKRSTPKGIWYDRDILGLWVAAEGMIYKGFDLYQHVIDEEPKDQREYWAGIDWGFEHVGVISVYTKDGDGKAYRLLEIADNQKSIEWWANEALKLAAKYKNLVFYADPARPDNIDALRQRGLFVYEAENAVVEGISFIAGLFSKNMLAIVKPTNTNYLKEIYNYRWKTNVIKEEPIKENDDSMDSERYALYSHLGKSKDVTAIRSLQR